MKKYFAVLLTVCLAILVIGGCAKKEEPVETTAAQKEDAGINIDQPIVRESAAVETDGEIFPLPQEVDFDNIADGIYPVQFDSNCIVGGGDVPYAINCEIYTEDYYDVVEVHNMKPGDMVQVDDEVFEIETVKDTMRGYVINGGVEEGGILLVPAEGGTYVSRGDNDHMSYTYQGDCGIDLADEVVLTDATLLSPGAQTETKGAAEVVEAIKSMEEKGQFFNQYNTTIRTENQKIVEIKVVYIP